MESDARAGNAPLESRAQVEHKWSLPLQGSGADLRLSGDGSLLAVGGAREGAGFIALVDKTGKPLWRYITREPIRCVAVSDVGGFAAAGCNDAQVYFFDRRGLLLWRYKCDRQITSIGVSRDGNTLAAGSEDCGVYYFDNRNTPRRFVWKVRMEGVVNAVAIVPSGDNVLAGSENGEICFIDAHEGNVAWKSFAKAPVRCVAASKFADVVAAGSDDGSVHCFDLGGRLLWERQTAGGIVDVSIDNRGAYVAALSKDGTLYFFDAAGSLVWSHPTGSPGGRLRLSKNGDLVFSTTQNNRLLCLSAAEGLIFEAETGGEAVTLDVSADNETLCLLEANAARYFETRTIFKSLILSLREYIVRCRERGADINPALVHEKQAVAHLKNFDYKGVHGSIAACEAALREQISKLSQDSEVQRRAEESYARQARAVQEAAEQGFDVAGPSAVATSAKQALEARDFGKALSVMQDAKGRFQDLEKKREQMAKARRLFDEASLALGRARMFAGVSLHDADMQLKMANEAMRERNFAMAAEYSALAQDLVLHARRSSPQAIEAEVRETRERLHGAPLGAQELGGLDAGLQNAIAYYAGVRSFKELGGIFELQDTLWSQQAKLKGLPTSSKLALEAAAYAYLDAGDAARAAELAERALDYKFAAKLREILKQPDEAQRILNRFGTQQRERRAEVASDGRKLDDYIGSLISAKKHTEAATELCKFDRYGEAASLLEGQRDPATVAFLLRIYFHLGRFDKLVAVCWSVEEALREEVRRGNVELLPLMGRMLAGHGFVAQVMGFSKELDRVADGWAAYLEDHAKRTAPSGPDRDADAAAVLAYLGQGQRAKVKALAELRQGPFFEWVRDAEVMIERKNVKGFRKMLALFERDFVARAIHMGSTLKTLVQPSSAADALDELFPFNINAQLLESYRTLVNADFFERLKVQGDQLLAAADYEKALPFFRELLQRDLFGVVPNVPIAARAAGIYLSRGDRESAHRLVAELGLDDAAVMAEVPKIPGFEAVGLEKRETARAATPEGKKCPNCGELVPKVAVRCFRCGTAIR